MSNIVAVCSHGPLAQALVESAGMISGVPSNLKTFPLLPGQDPYEYRAEIEAFLDEHRLDSCLLLVDLFGGTPSNMAASLSRRENVEVVSGVNLPMLIEVATRKDQMTIAGLRDLAIEVVSGSGLDVKCRFDAVLKLKDEEF